MSVKEIEKAIIELPSKQVSELMSWLTEHHARLWDKQIEDDLDAGRLDAFLAEVDKEYEAAGTVRFWIGPHAEYDKLIA